MQYLAFPRMGLGSEDARKWSQCGAPQTSAGPDDAERQAVAAKTCKNPVTMEYDVVAA